MKRRSIWMLSAVAIVTASCTFIPALRYRLLPPPLELSAMHGVPVLGGYERSYSKGPNQIVYVYQRSLFSVGPAQVFLLKQQGWSLVEGIVANPDGRALVDQCVRRIGDRTYISFAHGTNEWGSLIRACDLP